MCKASPLGMLLLLPVASIAPAGLPVGLLLLWFAV
jgi:hypothetical protein